MSLFLANLYIFYIHIKNIASKHLGRTGGISLGLQVQAVFELDHKNGALAMNLSADIVAVFCFPSTVLVCPKTVNSILAIQVYN